MEKTLKSYLIGDKNFYKKIITIAFPIIIQNLITNFVSLLDNIMVGQMGTDQMNGVSVVNQLTFIYHLCVWGSVCGAGIFTVQFFGKNDTKGIRDTFRAKIILSLAVTAGTILILYFFKDFFITNFLHETDSIGNAKKTLEYARTYLNINLIGLIPVAFSMAYGNTLRDIGETAVPMKSGVCAVAVNLILNYILIFGHFGFPSLGSAGAAIATVISRFAECSIIIIYTHTHKQKCSYIEGAYKSFKIPPALLKNIIIKGIPLALNETLWALGLTLINQSYSLRGLSVIAALNICSTISNLFNVTLFAIGESISIIVGHLLGASKMDEAKDSARKMIFLSISICFIIGAVMVLCRNFFPSIYNTETEVKILAARIILVCGCFMPIHACIHGCYFTLRTGGNTIITFLFDSFFVCTICVPVAFCLTHWTSLSIFPIYIIVTSLDIIKIFIGVYLVNKGVWINNLVKE